jgi:hypothetical protein
MRLRITHAGVVAVAILFLVSGCSIAPEIISTPTGLEPTLQAIGAMLTATASVPTITPTATPTIVPSPTITATPTPIGPITGRMGEWIDTGGIHLTVLSLQQRAQFDGIRIEQGRVFQVVEVLIENHSDQPQIYNPVFFTLVDQEDQEFIEINRHVIRSLMSGTLRPGEWVRGELVFETAESDTGFTVRYDPQKLSAEDSDEPIVLIPVSMNNDETPAPAKATASSWLEDDLHEPGQRILTDRYALTSSTPEVTKQMGRIRAGNGLVFVFLDITVENTTATMLPYNSQYFRAKDSAGYEYLAVGLPSDELLQAGSLREGQSASGRIVFEIPEGTEQIMVSYRPFVLFDEYQTVRILLDLGS